MLRFVFHMACAGLMAASFSAQAALVDAGWFTTDKSSGLDWLDLTETQGQSIEDAGEGTFVQQGWRIATYAQVRNLYSSNLETPHQLFVRNNFDRALSLARMMGVGFSSNTNEGVVSVFDSALDTALQSSGFFVDGFTDQFGFSGHGQASLAVILAGGASPSPGAGTAAWLAYPRYATSSQRYAYGGVYLVRESVSAVPEPGGLPLVLLGLVASCVVTRRVTARAREPLASSV